VKQLALPGAGLTLDEVLPRSVEAIRTFAPKDGPYYGLFSGGKDSVALREVARMAGMDVIWHYNVTTIDPPELVRFIKQHHPNVLWVRSPHGPFFRRAAEVKGLPTRVARWCCEEYKEARSPRGARLLMGIRAAESPRRAKTWGLVTHHARTRSQAINPLIHWPDDVLWEFIRGAGLPYSELYDEGFRRLGCVGCPMAYTKIRIREFERWPRFERRWRWVFERVWKRKHGTMQRDGRQWFGDRYFSGWEEMWSWWLHDERLPGQKDECQGTLEMWA